MVVVVTYALVVVGVEEVVVGAGVEEVVTVTAAEVEEVVVGAGVEIVVEVVTAADIEVLYAADVEEVVAIVVCSVVVGVGVEEDVGGVHTEGTQGSSVQVHPASTVQPVQPSLLTPLLSSHPSSCARTPSPQVDVHELGSALPQSKPHSTVHVDEHPSSLIVFASSHCSSV